MDIELTPEVKARMKRALWGDEQNWSNIKPPAVTVVPAAADPAPLIRAVIHERVALARRQADRELAAEVSRLRDELAQAHELIASLQDELAAIRPLAVRP